MPFINIDSSYADEVNDELHELYNILMKNYEENSKTGYDYNLVDYSFFENEGILSVIVVTESGGTAMPNYNYYTYNFDIKNGNKISYEETYTKLGFKERDIDVIAKQGIKSNVDYIFISGKIEENETVNKENSYKQSEIKYLDSIKNNTIKFYVYSPTRIIILTTIVGDQRAEVGEKIESIAVDK